MSAPAANATTPPPTPDTPSTCKVATTGCGYPVGVLRGEAYGAEHLDQHARQLAQSQRVDKSPRKDRRFVARFADNAEFLRSAYEEIAAEIRHGDKVTAEAEWLLDNYYIVEEQLREIRDDLPQRYYWELPKLESGEPRVYALALELVLHTDSALDEETIVRFVSEYQSVSPLSIGETWAVPIMLRLVLVENLRRVAAQMVATRRCRRQAQKLWEEWQPDAPFPLDLSSLDTCASIVLHMLEQFHHSGAAAAPALKRLEQQLAEIQLSVHDVTHYEHQRQAANQVSIGNIITSMRLISALDWVQFFERTNPAEQILREDPAKVYSQMDFESRNRYRDAVEQLARRTKHSDLDIAQQAIALARRPRQTAQDAQLQRHVGYWLVDRGRAVLEQETAYQPPLALRWRRWLLRHPAAAYFGSIAGGTALLVGILLSLALAGGAPLAKAWAIALLAIMPALDLAVSLTNLLVTLWLPPRLLPKLEFKEEVPAAFSTFVVVPSLLTSRREIQLLLQRLESHFLANPEPALRFALLTDFADADQQQLPADQELVAEAVTGIRQLNATYGAEGRRPFFLFHRERQWNPQEGRWMGWERKRGKLMEFNRLLAGAADTSYVVSEGDVAALMHVREQHSVQFVITLDADTQLPFGTARKLIGTLAHPLNRPRFDDRLCSLERSTDRVTAGYAVLQPRISVHLGSANRTWFSRLYANHPGIDPYTTAASDVYQDLFGEGSFTGKGIYDLRAFDRSLARRFGENQILSHDLIEGCHARVALVSDIEVIDGFPARYDADARRQHRWVRGDWQILPWLFPRVPTARGWQRNPLSLLSRWKIFDNLRRSLLPPTLLILLSFGWIFWPAQAWLTTAVGLLVLAFPLLTHVGMALRGWPREGSWRLHVPRLAAELVRSLALTVLSLAFLPHQAVLMLDAVVRTLVRLLATRRKLLEWETAAAAEHRLSRSQWSAVLHLWYVPLIAMAAAVFARPEARWLALPIAALWLVSPLLAHWISLPLRRRMSTLSEEQQGWLRILACKTWAFFEKYVGAEDHWLPPDNLQEYPQEKIAHRVSPTNEGLFLASALTARDFGFVGLCAVTETWERSLGNWLRLDRLRGHFYNWYDTLTLKPLFPRYVSTVDSGNLAACLLTVRQGIAELRTAPVLGPALWQGLQDTIAVARQALAALPSSTPISDLCHALERIAQHRPSPPSDPLAWHLLLHQLEADAALLRARLDEIRSSRDVPATDAVTKVENLLRWIASIQDDGRLLFPWAAMVAQLTRDQPPTNAASIPALPWQGIGGESQQKWRELVQHLSERTTPANLIAAAASGAHLHALRQQLAGELPDESLAAAIAWLDALAVALEAGSQAALELDRRLERLAQQMERTALEMDFRFLYNARRRLFSIGFNLEDEKLDRSHYDMLCSEARLASYLAIAKGDAEPRHWFQLGRQLTQLGGQSVLLSWGGTMFEYLMPPLFQQGYEGSLLSHSCRGAVARQQEYGLAQGVPWGVSESAYGALAANADYHYRSFGVPRLGLKRGLGEDLVVSPYSTMLALEVDPEGAVANLHHLVREGALGPWGLYDALDYSPQRVPAGKRSIVVRCYMAHHQGMSMLAMSNLLLDGCIRRRFNRHPLARSTELLLQERIPASAPLVEPHADEAAVVEVPVTDDELVSRRLVGVQTQTPRTHLLANGQYSVMVTNSGGSYSRWRDIAVTRWRPDTTCDNWGQFLYLRDVRSGAVWSATYQPSCAAPDAYEVIYSIDKAQFLRRDGELDTLLEITVSPENNAEVRQLTLTNHGSHPRQVEVTSYAEIALNTQGADVAHPAFQKLFIETEYIAEETALIARRRPRDSRQPALYAVHALACSENPAGSIQYETSRQEFLGRGRSPREPAALDPGARLSGQVGAVLDPIFSLRVTVTVRPHESVTLGLTTALASSREEALALADQYHDFRGVHRAFELAWAYHQVELRHLHLSPAKSHFYQRIAAALLYPDPTRRGAHELIRSNRLGQSGLWRHGISGDLPIVLIHVTQTEHADHVRELLSAHAYWTSHGLGVDVVVLNDYPGSYLDALHEQLVTLLEEAPRMPQRGGAIYLLRGAQLPREEKVLLEAAASVVFHGEHGSLAQQWDRPATPSTTPRRPPAQRFVAAQKRQAMAAPPTPASARLSRERGIAKLEFWNGYGGFAAGGREYHILLTNDRATPMPWSNVIANPVLGTLVTESGCGFTWFANSRENKLTSWSNDPVGDPPSEALYIRDETTGQTWSPLPAVLRDAGDYWIQHGQGYSRFVHHAAGIDHEVLVSIAPADPVKFVRVRLTNAGPAERTLSLTYFAEWVLGVCREQTQLHLQTEVDAATGALLVRNPYHPELGEQVAFLHVLGQQRSFTCDRTEFLGRNGDVRRPLALDQAQLSGASGPGLDPCGVVQTTRRLLSGAEAEVVFLLGAADNPEHLRQLLARYASPQAVQRACDETAAGWDALLGAVQVKTPNRALDLLVNRWLLYQTASCRMWGRSSFYQSGGAYGFRDQLQDSMALVYSQPQTARDHLLRAAARQFPEGDVQHWWHPPAGRGTRTRFSDDLLWLPLAVCHYVRITGDAAVLDDAAPFVRSPPLAAHEQERYELPTATVEQDSLYEHCKRAIAKGFTAGPHGLPLIGCGDWNDGFNRIGEEGRGESVWVGWFLLVLLREFIPLMRARGDDPLASEWETRADALRLALEQTAWDGQWYRRAYFDDGTPLGSTQNDECQIDSIAQTWAVMAGAESDRTDQALRAVLKQLVKRDEQLVLLFTPPLDQTNLDPGYVKGYLPGIRENGGQYTHAATWLIQALAQVGRIDDALAIYDLINPVHHAATSAGVAQYQVEPYVVAADVYGVPPHVGRGGWTWYTGSASWMYRVALESMLGLELRGNRLRLRPLLPSSWPGFELTFRRGRTTWKFIVSRNGPAANAHIEIELIEDGDLHEIHITPQTHPVAASEPVLEKD
ncbi:MAG TPA: glucoamylase family protein [Pirellulaceae bacterium]|nr:glucoamylase family protein [Pirellulaceae bacterium]